MPKFHNLTDREQKFELADRHYTVPPKGEVEIPEHLMYVVKSRRMPFAEGPAPDGAPRAEVREALPAEVEQNLGRLTPEEAAQFRAEWLRASGAQRTRMAAQLARVAERRAGLDDAPPGDEGEDDAPERAPETAPATDESGALAQVDEAARATGRTRRPR
jgi:hypothetical protein